MIWFDLWFVSYVCSCRDHSHANFSSSNVSLVSWDKLNGFSIVEFYLLYRDICIYILIINSLLSVNQSEYVNKRFSCYSVWSLQQILNEEKLTFKFLDVITILLNYCGPKLCESDDKEMKAVIRDLVVILGYFCANHKKNQVSWKQKKLCTFESIKVNYLISHKIRYNVAKKVTFACNFLLLSIHAN